MSITSTITHKFNQPHLTTYLYLNEWPVAYDTVRCHGSRDDAGQAISI